MPLSAESHEVELLLFGKLGDTRARRAYANETRAHRNLKRALIGLNTVSESAS